MQWFFAIFLISCLTSQTFGNITCYNSNNGHPVNDNTYCFYRKITFVNSNAQEVVSQWGTSSTGSPTIGYTEPNGQTIQFDTVNKCIQYTDKQISGDFYICNKDYCNDKCSATGYVLGFGLVIAFIAKFFA